MDASIIVCTHNRRERLLRCLQTLMSLEVPAGIHWELLVVDNNSSDGTRAAVESFGRRAPFPIRYAFEPRQGKSFALNTGIALARGGIVAFTDDDVSVEPGWLRAILDAFARSPCAGVGGRIVPLWTSAKPRWLLRLGMENLNGVVPAFDFGEGISVLEPPNAPYGANMAYRREMFERYGPFRTDLGPPGSGSLVRGEDTEFGFRLQRGGEMILYVPNAIVHHPVVPEVMTKRYFRRWYFNLGRAEVRLGPTLDGAVRYFGVPRYLFRDLATGAAAWLMTVDRGARLRRELAVCWLAGRIVESFRLRRRPIEASSLSTPVRHATRL